MEQQNKIDIGNPKRKYWKFVGGFLGIIVLVVGGFFVWDKYLSPQAKSQRQMEKQYEAYMEWEERHKQALREDTYGGKTPEETLKMFIEALKKEDIELASKYFVIDTQNSREEWKNELEKTKNEGKLNEIISLVSRAVPTPSQKTLEGIFWFSIYNDKKEVELLIEMSFNQQSGVWKIVNI